MKERPILFKTQMVRAILDGTKTETRHIMTKANFHHGMIDAPQHWAAAVHPARESGWIAWSPGKSKNLAEFTKKQYKTGFECPQGKVGDRLWVKEALWVSDCGKYFARDAGGGGAYDILAVDGSCVWDGAYRGARDYALPHETLGYSAIDLAKNTFRMSFADCDTTKKIEPFKGNTIIRQYEAVFLKRRSAMFMPRWASRLTLEITAIRVERLQEITEEDAMAEGVNGNEHPTAHFVSANYRERAYREAFRILWDRINGHKYRWADNPWVWVIEFKKLSENAADVTAKGTRHREGSGEARGPTVGNLCSLAAARQCLDCTGEWSGLEDDSTNARAFEHCDDAKVFAREPG